MTSGQPSTAIPLRATEPTLFSLGQPWQSEPDAGLRPTEVRARFAEGALLVEAEMVDDDVFNTATAHNQRTWETGDVFEVFVRRDDQESYTEVHVTPDNVKLHFRFADFGHCTRLADFDEVAADPAEIESTAERTRAGWRATARIPVEAGPGELIRVSFCRYDATRGAAEPVLSTSSPHPEVAFHRPLEWTLCRIEG